MKGKPIKRTEELKTFSREHHFGLLFSWKIKEGIKFKVVPDRLRAYVNYFWENHLKQHFLNEEMLLFDQIDAKVCRQAKADHLAIIAQIDVINTIAKDDVRAYELLAEQLKAHIRLEERTVFPYLEREMSSAMLHKVSNFLKKEQANDFKDNYKDEFWIKENN